MKAHGVVFNEVTAWSPLKRLVEMAMAEERLK